MVLNNDISLPQQKALAVIPHITGFLSFFGSCSILYDILWSNRRQKLQRPYYRILLGMSVFDAVASFSLGMSTWPIPRGSEGVWGAVGTTQTCTAQGFFNQLILGSPFYNLMLATYYLLLGSYHLSEEEIASRYERYMHVAAIVPPVGFGISGLPLTLYNNANLWCWIAPGSEGRGHNFEIYRWAFFYGPLWFIIVAITVMMVVLTRSVKREEKRFIEMILRQSPTRRGSRVHDEESSGDMPEGKMQEEESSDMSTYETPAPGIRSEAYNLQRSRKMFNQALFYVLAFYLTYVWATINRLVQLFHGHTVFFLLVTTAFFAPLQGFFNCLIYRHGPCVA